MVQNVDLDGDRRARGFQVAERRRDPSLRQVVAGVIIEADDQEARVVASGGEYQIVQVGEVS